MPKESGLEGSIPRLYKRTALNQMMFAYVVGARNALPTLSIKEAVFMFMETFGVDDDEYNCDSGVVIFQRMQIELITTKKSLS